jgi:5-bromo-4-chloroindolyl phosphate hydrolysis protein
MKASVVFGVVWLIMNTLFILLDTSPIIVISFVSAVLGFYTTYFLPIYMTVKKGDYVAKDVED